MPSKVIYGMRYVPRQQVLDIVFSGGRGTYRYYDVEPEEWIAFKRAPSKGTYLNTIFRSADHRYERLDSLAAVPAVQDDAVAPGHALRDVPEANVWGFYDDAMVG